MEPSILAPSAARARRLRMEMDAALIGSVRPLLDLSSTSGESAVAAAHSVALRDPVWSGRVHPVDYAAYFDLVLLPQGEDETHAKAASRVHLAQRFAEGNVFTRTASLPGIVNFDDAHFTDFDRERMARWWDIDPENPIDIAPATADQVACAQTCIPAALDRLARADAELHAEIAELIDFFVLARPIRSDFGGATSFALFGAPAINATCHADWTAFFGTIVHETAHTLLFANARTEPLVTDDPSLRRASPLRADLRPLDGIYHAAFVSVREAMAYDRLLTLAESEADVLSGDERRAIEAMLEGSVNAFDDCRQTLRTDAHLSGLGETILSECETYMDAHFAFAET